MIRGLEVKLNRTELKSGDKAILSFHFEPHGAISQTAVTFNVTVQPLNFVIPVRVSFE